MESIQKRAAMVILLVQAWVKGSVWVQDFVSLLVMRKDLAEFAAEVGFALTSGVANKARNTKAKAIPKTFLFIVCHLLSRESAYREVAWKPVAYNF
jgi:hypothetical protein